MNQIGEQKKEKTKIMEEKETESDYIELKKIINYTPVLFTK